MVIELIGLIAFTALVLYVLFGGADYGAGILELFRRRETAREQERLITRAIGPVWEANHIWLILITVILFNGFPPLYQTLTTSLHIPMVAVLVGIVIRGVNFTFRHYDVADRRRDRFYTGSFALSSLWTAVWLGVLVGACILGRLDPAGMDVFTVYIRPWLNLFSFAVGLFVACVFTYLAACFLVGEADSDRMKRFFVRRALLANVAVVLSGALVFVAAEADGLPLAARFAAHPGSLLAMAVATAFWWAQWASRRRWNFVLSRVLAAGQVVSILVGFALIQSPVIMMTAAGPLTLENSASPPATLWQLLLALLVGLAVILPSLAVLFWIFKFRRPAG